MHILLVPGLDYGADVANVSHEVAHSSGFPGGFLIDVANVSHELPVLGSPVVDSENCKDSELMVTEAKATTTINMPCQP